MINYGIFWGITKTYRQDYFFFHELKCRYVPFLYTVRYMGTKSVTFHSLKNKSGAIPINIWWNYISFLRSKCHHHPARDYFFYSKLTCRYFIPPQHSHFIKESQHKRLACLWTTTPTLISKFTAAELTLRQAVKQWVNWKLLKEITELWIVTSLNFNLLELQGLLHFDSGRLPPFHSQTPLSI